MAYASEFLVLTTAPRTTSAQQASSIAPPPVKFKVKRWIMPCIKTSNKTVRLDKIPAG